MRLSSRVIYGTRAMLELGMHHGAAPVSMGQIARNQRVPKKYLHSLLTSLRAANLVRSVRGSGGGYVLSRPPDEINLSEIVGVLEGPLVLVPAARKGAPEFASVTLGVWRELGRLIESHLAGLTLSELLERQRQHDAGHPMYYI